MATIEERYGNPQEPYCFETDREEQWYKCGQVDGATEQDRIARQEEREKAWILFSELIDADECDGYCETFLITKDDFFDEMEGGNQ